MRSSGWLTSVRSRNASAEDDRLRSGSPERCPISFVVQCWSEKTAEFFGTESGVANNTAHCECLDWIMARDSYLTLAIAHNDMFALPNYSEPYLLQCTDRILMVDSGNPSHN
jgi:hypothetical protein